MLDGFKKFILRGNVVDMAVGVVIGAAFASVVNGLTSAILTPLIKLVAGLVGGGEKFSANEYTIHGVLFPLDNFINAVISFVLIAAAVYFLVVLPINALVARMNRGEKPPDPTTKKCPECLSEIPIEARRCAHCTQPVLGRAA
ncbi:MAG: large conductance mechanosensitive channel protein MscL [Candidatus Sulfotelmatobacter sp.]